MDTKTQVTYTRQKLKEIAMEPLVAQVVTRVYASATIGCISCIFTIPDMFIQISVQSLIKILQPRLIDVTFEQTDTRTISIDWS